MFELLKTEGNARRGRMTTVHGVIETPVFMNVGTSAAVKGGVSTADLEEIGTQVELSNTYHLHIRPGDELIKAMGGLHKFFHWNKPILTDSGGFQVFSLSKIRKIYEEGVYFNSHMDGKRIFMGPEESMRIQSNIASTIAMAFDECVENPAPYEYVKQSSERTIRWLARCRREHERLNSLPDTINKQQLLFGINQGGTYEDIRIDNMRRIAEEELDGYAIGGLAVGEGADEMYRIIEAVEPHMPKDKPRYLMGVGTPQNILEAVYRGVDFFDCVMPSRNARHGNLFTWHGKMNINNEQYYADEKPIDPICGCPVCRRYSRSYIRHLFKAREMLGMRLAVIHNLYFYNELTAKIREALDEGRFTAFYHTWHDRLAARSEDFSPVPERFRNRVLYRDPTPLVPVCIREGIDLGAPAGKAMKRKKKDPAAPGGGSETPSPPEPPSSPEPKSENGRIGSGAPEAGEKRKECNKGHAE